MTPAPRTKVLHVRVTAAEMAELRELARRNRVRLSELVRALLTHRLRVKVARRSFQ
jgi:hypothetical protein